MKAITKLRMAKSELNVQQAELANRTIQSRANLSKKMVKYNFRIYEYAELVEALGCKFEFSIILPNGDRL